MKRALRSVAIAIALVVGVSAQEKPNFAGKWKPDGSFTTYTIAVEGNQMTVTHTMAGNSESTVYLLDGTPSKKTVEGPNGFVEHVRTSTWDGTVLVTAAQVGPAFANIERRWLEPDGTMRVQTTVTMVNGKPAPPPPPGVGAPMVLRRIK